MYRRHARHDQLDEGPSGYRGFRGLAPVAGYGLYHLIHKIRLQHLAYKRFIRGGIIFTTLNRYYHVPDRDLRKEVFLRLYGKDVEILDDIKKDLKIENEQEICRMALRWYHEEKILKRREPTQ